MLKKKSIQVSTKIAWEIEYLTAQERMESKRKWGHRESTDLEDASGGAINKNKEIEYLWGKEQFQLSKRGSCHELISLMVML